MNVQKSLYNALLRLGVDMIHPQGYRCSESDRHPDLVFSFLKWEDGGTYVLLATYLIDYGKAFPAPEVVLWVSPKEKRATVFTCEWQNGKEIASTELDHRVLFWLGLQRIHGHHFLGIPKMSGNVVAFRSVRRPHVSVV